MARPRGAALASDSNSLDRLTSPVGYSDIIRLFSGTSNDCDPPETRIAARAGNASGDDDAKGLSQPKRYQNTSFDQFTQGNLAVALDLAAAGFAVFPCKERGPKGVIKTPYTARGFKDATTNEDQIRRWWKQWPGAVVGLPTGMNGIAVLDLDRKDGKDGVSELLDRGLLPRSSVSVRTPSGGRHLIFKDREGLAATGGKLPNGSKAPGVDVRAAGSYIIAPGSIMADGSAYEHERGSLVDTTLTAWPRDREFQPRQREPHRHCGEGERTGLTFDEFADALMLIPNDGSIADNDDRDWWLRIVQGVHHETDGSAKGRRLVHRWSRQWVDYDRRRTDEAWGSSGKYRGAPVTGETVLYHARRHGWIDTRTVDVDPDEFDNLPPMPKPKGARLTFLTPSDCEVAETRGYVMKGFVAPGDVGCIFGAPGVGKSLFAPHIAYAVAQGRSAFGMRAKSGKVFYVAAEDETGMRSRVRALKDRWGDAPDFLLVGGCSDLLSKGSADLRALFQAVEEQRPSLIFIDTLAMAFPGLEENDAASMGHAVAVARKLAGFGAAVILVHHGTKEDTGTPRGHSVLNGALDMAIHLTRDGDIIRGQLTKNRNGPCDRDIAFRIATREFGEDEDGDPIKFPLVEELEDTQRSKFRLSKSAKAALAILENLGGSSGGQDWRNACMAGRDVSPSENKDSRRRAADRAVRELLDERVVQFFDDAYHMQMPELHWDDDDDLV